MKNLHKNVSKLSLAFLLLVGCSDFESVNKDPNAADIDQVKVEYSINKSITDAQQNPEVAERAFVLSWMGAARMQDPNNSGGLTVGSYSDDWHSNYYNNISSWMSSITQAIHIADLKMEGSLNSHDQKVIPNLKQVARIWRVYLMSEFTDCFGAMPIEAFNGKNPEFNSAKEVYYFLLKELKEAAEELDLEVQVNDTEKESDRAYKFDFAKWKKYANSMRMRLAMRLSEVDPAKAQAEFEDAVKGEYIAELADNFAIQERDGWDPLAGVMTREWNSFPVSATINNLIVNLGGISSEEALSNRPNAILLKGNIKPNDYMGIRYDKHMTLLTNDPAKGFWYDGLHHTIDPRAYELYQIPGDFTDENYCTYPTYNSNYKVVKRKLLKDQEDKEGLVELDATYTWNASACGEWGDKGSLNKMWYWPWALPNLKLYYRNHTNKRIFFAAWESYFLIAEAAVRQWNVPMDGKSAYETGIRKNFDHFGITQYVGKYLASESYNNVGTSVKWEHTTAATAKEMTMIDGYTNKEAKYTYEYPDGTKSLYGKPLNDQLSKIITQKYLANVPYLPLEGWSDYRRLALPFMETPAVEKPIQEMPTLTSSNYDKQTIKFFPQRMKFPSILENSNPEGYKKAVELLGGPDDVFTPMWWAKH
ncbi:hypothetical protein Bcop_1627 [Bacteroides coprosuis DSM 18011]|uniref:Lipoprotein n=1 Tax=Bacteroides coprosuis DSM 18011 TaxID=679937 RepID=F3ZQM4_9BACE|nr:SusD/RagB family nutrient-binding outer membrane lipoprotein [Bacteroides coprosuis]EGJ71819.1 hypothetical protein Bcop_1627 [Bacteroides coprosuis DSM 18011]